MLRLPILTCAELNIDPSSERLSRSILHEYSVSVSGNSWEILYDLGFKYLKMTLRASKSERERRLYYFPFGGIRYSITKTRLEIWAALGIWYNFASNQLRGDSLITDEVRSLLELIWSRTWENYGQDDNTYDTIAALLTGCDSMVASDATFHCDSIFKEHLAGIGLGNEYEKALHGMDYSSLARFISYLVEFGQCMEPKNHKESDYAERLRSAHTLQRSMKPGWTSVIDDFTRTLAIEIKKSIGISGEIRDADLGLPFHLVSWDFIRPARCLKSTNTQEPITVDVCDSFSDDFLITDHLKVLHILQRKEVVIQSADIFDSRSVYFIKEKEKGRARTPFMLMPVARALYMRIDSILGCCMPKTQYVRYLGHSDVPTFVKHVNDMLHVGSMNEHGRKDIYAISVDIRAFCLTVCNSTNTYMIRSLFRELNLPDYMAMMIGLCDFLANTSTFTPSVNTGPETDTFKSERISSYQRAPDIHINWSCEEACHVGGPDWSTAVSRVKSDRTYPFLIPGVQSFYSQSCIYPMMGSPEGLLQPLWSTILMSILSDFSKGVWNEKKVRTCSILSGDNVTVFMAAKDDQQARDLKMNLLMSIKAFGFQTKETETVIMKNYAVPLRQHIYYEEGQFRVSRGLIKTQLSAISKDTCQLTVIEACIRALGEAVTCFRSQRDATYTKSVMVCILKAHISLLLKLSLTCVRQVGYMSLLCLYFHENITSLFLVLKVFEYHDNFVDIESLRLCYLNATKGLITRTKHTSQFSSSIAKSLWNTKTTTKAYSQRFEDIYSLNNALLRYSLTIPLSSMEYGISWRPAPYAIDLCSESSWVTCNLCKQCGISVKIEKLDKSPDTGYKFPVPQIMIRNLTRAYFNIISQTSIDEILVVQKSLQERDILLLSKCLYVSSFKDMKNPTDSIDTITRGNFCITSEKAVCPLKLWSIVGMVSSSMETLNSRVLHLRAFFGRCTQYKLRRLQEELSSIIFDLRKLLPEVESHAFNTERLEWTMSLITNDPRISDPITSTHFKEYDTWRNRTTRPPLTIFATHSSDQQMNIIDKEY